MNDHPHSLASLLRLRAETEEALLLYVFQSVAGRDARTAGQLYLRARRIAAALCAQGLSGRRVILLFPPGLDFIDTFFGCLLANVVPAPAPMPARHRLARTLPRLRGMMEDARPAAVLTTAEGLAFADLVGGPPWLVIDAEGAEEGPLPPAPTPDAPAHLQYTSGSTSQPKGTVITHRNLLANSWTIQQAWGFDRSSRSVVWVPHFHDDGLVQGILQPLYTGFSCRLMPAADFVGQPARWLQAISETRATHSGGPNFAYDLCVRKVTDEELAGLDLSSWRMAYNAAEPVRAETVEAFAQRFRAAGFDPRAMAPCFGLAESTLLVTGGLRPAGPTVLSVDASILHREGRVHLVEPGPSGVRRWVGCGQAAPGASVWIVHPSTLEPLPEGSLGEVVVGGPSVAAGYLDRPSESAETFGVRIPGVDGPLLRTGDQGFLWQRELFVTGRLKEVIIVRGENRYPHDIELTVARCHPALVSGGVAAFSVNGPGAEGLGLIAEVRAAGGEPVLLDIVAAIRAAVSEAHDLSVDGLGLLPPGHLPKTSSGKIMRRAAALALSEGSLPFLTLPAPPMPPAASLRGELGTWLRERLGALLGVPVSAVDPDQPFAALGIDSVVGVQLMRELSVHLGREVAPTTLWAHPTLRQLLAHLEAGSAPKSSPAPAAPPSAQEPIAIIGVGCRLPGGVNDLDGLWSLLASGQDCVVPTPEGRFDEEARAAFASVPGGGVGGFLPSVDGFDPAFFSLSPREAEAMDPQQRLLLEVTAEALQSAGLSRRSVAGRDGGVYVGISSQEYAAMGQRARGGLDPHLFLGTAHSTGVGRISYWLGLNGPNVAMDTACSSSLVAIHMAVSALRAGECSFALAGGVNLILDPQTTRCLGQLRALSGSGRCHSFLAEADGYVRAEGCALIVCKRLSDAQRDGDRVLALILGSAINQDGRSNGLTAPHGPSQEAVIRRALTNAGLAPDAIDFVEAHGTGTPLGDPIEMGALDAVFGPRRSAAAPLWVGALKAQIGHLESAAGVAGLLKVVAALQQEQIPAQPRVGALNPRLPAGDLAVPFAPRPWGRGSRPRVAGLSSFGLSGTNAHVVIGEAPVEPAPATKTESPLLFAVSARSLPALRQRALDLARLLEAPSAPSPVDLAFTLACRHDAEVERLVVLGGADLTGALRAFAAGPPAPLSVSGRAPTEPPPVIFVFGGQGTAWPGMATDLLDVEAAFTRAFDAVEQALRPHWALSLRRELARPAQESRLDETEVAQPAIFAVQVALAAQLAAWGLAPQAVLGHSVGEIAAAHIAGLLPLEQAARLVALRGRVMAAAHGDGAMVAVERGEDWLRETLPGLGQGLSNRVDLAAVNDPGQVVLSGPAADIETVIALLRARGIEHRRLAVTYAFHSAQMEPLRLAFEAELGPTQGIGYEQTPLYSTVTGMRLEAGDLTTGYWGRNLRQTVRLAGAVKAAAQDFPGALFVEVSPHSSLSVNLQRLLSSLGGRAVSTLRRQAPGPQRLRELLASAWVAGLHLKWSALLPPGRVTTLPAEPYARQRCWLAAGSAPVQGHPLKGPALRSSLDPDGTLFSRPISADAPGFLADHRLDDEVVWPGAATLELARAACAELFGAPVRLQAVELLSVLPLGGARQVELMVKEPSAGRRRFTLRSAAIGGRSWTTHATGEAERAPSPPHPTRAANPNPTVVDEERAQALRHRLREAGLSLGPAFTGLRGLRPVKEAAIGWIVPPSSLGAWSGGPHPALLDAALQVAGGLLPDDPGQRWIPAGVASFWQSADPTFAQAQAQSSSVNQALVDLQLFDSHGQCVGEVKGLRLRAQRAATLPTFELGTMQVEASHPLPRGSWEIVGPAGPLARGCASALAAAGAARWSADDQAPAPDNLVLLADGNSDDPLQLMNMALSVLQRCANQRSRVWIVTVGALAPRSSKELAQSSLWGLARSVAMEAPSLGLTCIDLDTVDEVDALLCSELLRLDPAETQIQVVEGAMYALRLRPAAPVSASLALNPEGWVVLTGGFGGLGLSLARQLVATGHRRLCLIGRRAPDRAAQSVLSDLRTAGATLVEEHIDVADRGALSEALTRLRASGRPLNGVIHLAGTLADRSFETLGQSELQEAWGPKAQGAANLHALTLNDPIQLFVMYGSAAAVIGSAGQAAYAAANAFLGGLAHLRRSMGLPATCIHWGPFADVGMATTQPSVLSRLNRLGLAPLKPSSAGSTLLALAAGEAEQPCVLRIDPSTWVAAHPTARRLFSELLHEPEPAAPVQDLPTPSQVAGVEEQLRAELAAVLRVAPHAIPSDASLLSLGVDSLLAIEIRDRIASRFGQRLTVLTLLEIQRVADLVALLESEPPGPVGAQTPDSSVAPLSLRDRLPLSDAQRRLWLIEQMSPGTALHNMELSLDIEGHLEVELLHAAVAALFHRHELLRAVVEEEEHQPWLCIQPPPKRPLEEVHLTVQGSADGKVALEAATQARAASPMALDQGPLARVTLFRLEPEHHRLQWVIHHIIADAWSFAVLLDELAQVYRALLRDQLLALPALPLGHAALVAAQLSRPASPAYAASLAYWKQQLAGLPTLNLPGRPLHQPIRPIGDCVPFELPDAQLQGLEALALSTRSTLFVVLAATWALTLHRLCGQDDIALGTVSAGRSHPDVRGLVGFFVCTLVLRCDCSGRPTFRQWVDRMRAVVNDALLHEEVPFDEVVRACGAPRGSGLNPLYQASFTLESVPLPQLEGLGGEWRPVLGRLDGSVEGTAKNELNLTLMKQSGRLCGSLEFATDRLTRSQAERIVSCFVCLVQAVVTDPEQTLDRAPLLDLALLARVRGWSEGPPAPRLAATTVVAQLAATVAQHPERCAMEQDASHLSYADLWQRAQSLGRHLVSRGVQRERTVGLVADRSPSTLIGYVAILLAGGVCVPFDPSAPQARNAQIVEDAGFSLLLAPARLMGQAPPDGVETITIEGEGRSEAALPTVLASDAAYLIFTSGSTGRPKGVVVEHRQVMALLAATGWSSPRYAPGCRVLHRTALTVDVAVLETLIPLCMGGTVLFAPGDSARSPAALAALIRSQAITYVDLPPALLGPLLEEPDFLQATALQVVTVGGDRLEPSLQARFAQTCAAQLYNNYGPTEATVEVTSWPCPRQPTPVVIGRPLPGCEVWVREPSGALCPPGVPGELWIGGPSVARGYWRRPEETAARFVLDPLGSAAGDGDGRLYRTGDRVAWTEEGELDFIGRTDAQVKLRGHRIELGEIESAIAAHPQVAAAAVLLREDRPGHPMLVAYVESTHFQLTPARLREHLRERLPASMMPSVVLIEATLPTLPSGKIDRSALPAPGISRDGEVGTFEAPRTETESVVASIWEELLDVRPVGVHDEFFALGGHSLLAILLASALEKRFGRPFAMAKVLELRTIAEQADAIDRPIHDEASQARTPLFVLRARGERPPLFLMQPTGATVFCYSDLARHLGDDQPVYGLQEASIEGATHHLDSVESLAARYISAVRAVVPKGPVFLGGWSFGGVVAFEMARQLELSGDPAAMIFIIDSAVPGSLILAEPDLPSAELFLVARYLQLQGILADVSAFRSLEPAQSLVRLAAAVEESGWLAPGRGEGFVRGLAGTILAHWEALARYTPSPIQTTIQIVRAAEQPQRLTGFLSASWDWSPYSRGLIFTSQSSGQHGNMIYNPNARHLAALIRGLMDNTTFQTSLQPNSL